MLSRHMQVKWEPEFWKELTLFNDSALLNEPQHTRIFDNLRFLWSCQPCWLCLKKFADNLTYEKLLIIFYWNHHGHNNQHRRHMFHLCIRGTKRRFLSPPFPWCEVFFSSSTDPDSTSFIFSFDFDSKLLSFSEDNSSCSFLLFSGTPCLQKTNIWTT